MSKPRLLDLFCGGGGGAYGYHQAGFEVVGVDIEPQPNYPFEFVQMDALLWTGFDDFDLVHASPPCQSYSKAMSHLSNPQPRLIEPVRSILRGEGKHYVIENVNGAPLRDPVRLCGSSFGLRVWRHRLFEASLRLSPPPCCHNGPTINPYNSKGRQRIFEEFGKNKPDIAEIVWRKEMGVPWMGRYEARESFPPAYTKWIGEQFLAQVESHVRA